MQLEDLPIKLQEQAKQKLALVNGSGFDDGSGFGGGSKFHAIKCEVDGHRFDSRFEAEHYASLKLLAKAGIISDLRLQPRFLIQEGFVYNGHKERKIEYVADFQYVKDGKTIVEDTKSKATRTQVYMLKRKLFLYRYGSEITFREVLNETD